MAERIDRFSSYDGNPILSCTSKMKTLLRAAARIVAGICLSLGFGSLAFTQNHSQTPNAAQKVAVMTTHASGTFEVKLSPQAQEDKSDNSSLGRMSIDKQFHGDLEGTSKGQMLTAGTAVEGSAGYVAIERVSGTLHGRRGTFVLQHSGTMTRGAPQLSVTVVPDSGTGELVGLAGKMTITISDGKHSYDFEYTLTKTP
jgi:Protein of unknown function (DUF3224)